MEYWVDWWSAQWIFVKQIFFRNEIQGNFFQILSSPGCFYLGNQYEASPHNCKPGVEALEGKYRRGAIRPAERLFQKLQDHDASSSLGLSFLICETERILPDVADHVAVEW